MTRVRVAVMIALAVGAAACSTETDLAMRVQGDNAEGETVPISNVKLDVIPYDIDELYEELEAETRPGSPPSADSLAELAQTYQDACTRYRATSDSIETVRERATQIANEDGQTSDAYRQAFGQYEALVDREEQRFGECQDVTETYTAVRNEYRTRRTEWEEEAWPADRFAAAESTRVGEQPIQSIETGPEGAASVTVPNGTWWVLGTAPVPGSTSQEYRWNVRVEATGGQDTVRLTGENAELQPSF